MSKFFMLVSGTVIVSLIWAGMWGWRVTATECWFNDTIQNNCELLQQLNLQRLLTLNLDETRWQTVRSFSTQDQQNWQLVHWSKRLPHTVVLKYESSPGVYVMNSSEGGWWLVNQRGFLQSLPAEAASQSALTKIFIGPKWPATDYANYQLVPSLHLWLSQLDQTLTKQIGQPSRITLVDSFTVEIDWPNWQLVIEPLKSLEQITLQISQIKQLLTEKSQTLGGEYKKLDLRFKLPVLEPKNPSTAKPFPSLVAQPTASSSALTSSGTLSPTKKQSLSPTPILTSTPTSKPKN